MLFRQSRADPSQMVFRQLFDSTSGTYSYLMASRRGGEALIIDPVLEKVDRYLQLVKELDLKLVKALDLVGGQLQGLPVGGRGQGGTAGPTLQVGPGGRQQVVAGQGPGRLQPVHQGQAGVRTVGHRDGHGPVELIDGRGPQPQQLGVQGHDLEPVGVDGAGGQCVLGDDGRLELIGPWSLAAQGPVQQAEPLADHGRVPAIPVLLLERDQVAVGVDPGVGAGMLEDQQRQQTTDLGVVGDQLGQEPPEPDRLGGQVDPEQPVAAGGVIALVEDQVHDRADGPDPVGELVVGREPERDGCHGDLAFGPNQPLLQGPLGNQKGPGDLSWGQPGHRPQGQGDLGIDPKGRMAAHQDQRQLIVVAAARWPTGSRLAWRSIASSRANSSVRSARRRSRRSRSIALRRAVVISQASGWSGMPSRGQVRRACSAASWTASSARSTSSVQRHNTATARAQWAR